MASESKNANALESAGAWANEAEFIGAHDSVCMSASAVSTSGEFSFDFSAVTGDIDGIEVVIHRAWNGNDYATVELYDSTSAWRAKTSLTNAAGDCASATDETLGTPTDLWGGTWTAAHITSTAFRIRVTGVAIGKVDGYWGADSCTVTVYYTPSSIAKGFADTGAGSDVFAKTITLLSKAFVDTIGGADVFTQIWRSMGFSDVAGGADVFATPYREMEFVDAGAGGDVFAKVITFQTKAFVDVGSGSDVFILLRFLDFIDSGAGVDVISLTRPIYFTDAGGGVDVFTNPYREMEFVDVVAGADSFATPFRAMGFVDSGSGAEVFFLLAEKGFADSGLGTDVFTVPLKIIAVAFVDSGAGADVFVTPYREMGFSDTIAGVDIFELLRLLEFTDSISGVDAFSLLRAMGFTDLVSGSDVFTVPPMATDKAFVDTATGVDLFTDPTIIIIEISEADKDDIVDKVWDEMLADHLIAGSTGEKLNSTGTATTAPKSKGQYEEEQL